MNENKNEIETQNSNQNQGFYAQPRAYLSRDRQYLVLALPGNMLVRKHVNWFKKILGVEFSAVAPKPGMENVA